jgi:ferredoxin
MGQAISRILVRHGVCSGCRACEVACVAQHEGRFGTAATRIHVVKIEPAGVDEPHVCHLCRRAPCVAACPTEALYRDDTDVFACQVRERAVQVNWWRSDRQRAHGIDRRRSRVFVHAYSRLPAKKRTTNVFTFQGRERELQVKR